MPPEHSSDRPQPRGSMPGDYAPMDDEISLIDLWKVLERRRWWLIGIAALVLLAGTTYALLQTPHHEFRTVIHIPDLTGLAQVSVERNHQGRENVTIDYPPGTSAQLLEPSQLAHDLQARIASERLERGKDHARFDMDLRQKEGSSHWVIVSRTPAEAEDLVRDQHEEAVPGLLAAIEDKLEPIRAPIEERLRQIERESQAIQSEADHRLAILAIELEALDRRLALLDERATLIEQHRESATNMWDDARSSAPISGDWAGFLTHIQRLEQAVETWVPEEREHAALQAAQIRAQTQYVTRTREMQMQRLDSEKSGVESKKLTLSRPDVLGDIGAMSAGPVDDRRSLMIALSGVLGLMLGVFGAFFREFLANVRATDAG